MVEHLHAAIDNVERSSAVAWLGPLYDFEPLAGAVLQKFW
jgi:hypothetical protein